MPSATVPLATDPSVKRGTITSSVTQRTASDDATVASANTAAPPTATANVPGCIRTSARASADRAGNVLPGARAEAEATDMKNSSTSGSTPDGLGICAYFCFASPCERR